MSDHFQVCLAVVLQFETGYPQKPGGPFRRNADGSGRIPTKPDGMAFDDDPNDTGGRTFMGILQRVYDASRDRRALPRRDVWLAEDHEVADIYRRQYWEPLRCDELPLPIALLTFDGGVNCGIGMGARFLQRALGIKDDGHIGQVTLAKANEITSIADLQAFAERFAAVRETYYRACKTFRHHGKGWLKRNKAATEVAFGMIGGAGWRVDVDFAEHSRQALPPAPAQSVAETNTGGRETFQGAAGGGLSLERSFDLYAKASQVGLMEAINKNPATVALILIGIGLVLNARFGWLDRGRKLILGV